MQPNLHPVATAAETGDEITPVDSLLLIDNLLSALDREPPDARCVELPVAEVKRMGVLLLGSLRSMDEVGRKLCALPLREREATTQAYQLIRQCTAMAVRRIESTLEQLR